MKKLSVITSVLGLAMVLGSSLAFAAPSEHLNWGAQIHSGPSACPTGKPVINVVQKIINTVDSGEGGNYWAYDDLVRQIQVVQTDTDAFCASVSYQGNFTTIAGTSPGATGVVGDEVVGTFQGGYVATFTGTLMSTPTRRTKGSIGTDDYNCDDTGDCPGSFFWADLYFENIGGFVQPWWGWVYHAGNNGSWTNASSGNSGDITGN